ncbi:response regulator [Geopsychrobacter electrodiphilus]|uniref:response regulator n=1 Tax=Geopsychrobacter electrodiphilus TaxID=225196 RepID=UPI000365824A|nr:response regulator transcription factor [Geopsychrobacter electrodiphilus]
MSTTYNIRKVLIADDHSLLRNGLKQLLQQLWSDITVVESNDCRQTLDMMGAHPDIDLVLFDLNMPGLDGFKVLEILANNPCAAPIIVVTASDDIFDMQRTLDAGAVGYILKSESNEVILRAIQLVLAGGIYVTPSITCKQAGGRGQANLSFSKLTSRQCEVLRLMMQGASNKDIAKALNLSEVTVKTHVGAILKTLDVVSRTQAVLAAKKLGYQDK